MHDQLFLDQGRLDLRSLTDRAKVLGLDVAAFEACLNGASTTRVQADLKTGRGLAVSGTPTFFAGTVQPDGRVKVQRRLTGAAPVAEFKATLDNLLSTSQKYED
jgi:protein-disulfide isomerase